MVSGAWRWGEKTKTAGMRRVKAKTPIDAPLATFSFQLSAILSTFQDILRVCDILSLFFACRAMETPGH